MFEDLTDEQRALVEGALVAYKHGGRGRDVSDEVDELLEEL